MANGEKENKKGEKESMWAKIFMNVVTNLVNSLSKDTLKTIPDAYKRLRSWWNGKCIAVIGPTASGKNSMYSKLKREKAPTEYIQTRGAEEVGTFKFIWPLPDKSTIEFQCKRSINVGGEVDERERYWLQSCTGADVIFYLVDSERLAENTGQTLVRIKEDLKWMASNFPNFKSKATVHILLNKVDIFTSNIPPERIEEFIKNSLSEKIEKIEDISKKILGEYFERITGVSPISMTDSFLFSKYFTASLKQISKSLES